MKASVVSKKYKKQFLELKFLYADLEYYEDALKEAQEDFQEAFYEYSKINNLGYSKPEEQQQPTSTETTVSTFVEEQIEEQYYQQDVPPIPETEEEIEEPDEKDEDISKLYKKIASMTHPDAIPKGEKEELKEKRIQQFMEAQEAHKNKNWFQLCQIAIDLGIEVPEPKKQHLKWMDQEAIRIRNRVEHIKSTFAWVWYNEEEELRRHNLMKHYFQALAAKK
jgi:hypothetical protein